MLSRYAISEHQAVSNYPNASIIGINLQLFGEDLLTELVNLVLCYFQMLCKLYMFTFKAIYHLLHVGLLSRLVRKDLLVTL